MGSFLTKLEKENGQLELNYYRLKAIFLSRFEKDPEYIKQTLEQILDEYSALIEKKIIASRMAFSLAEINNLKFAVLFKIAHILQKDLFANILSNKHFLIADIEKNPELKTEKLIAWKSKIDEMIVEKTDHDHQINQDNIDTLIADKCRKHEIGLYNPKYRLQSSLLMQLKEVFKQYCHDNKMLVVTNLIASLNNSLLNRSDKTFYNNIKDKLDKVTAYENSYYKTYTGCFSFFANKINNHRREASTLKPLLKQAEQLIKPYAPASVA